MRIICGATIWLAVVLHAAPAAASLWCQYQGGVHYKTPECADSPGYKGVINPGVTQTRIHNVCSGSDPTNGIIDINVVYPSPGIIEAGDQLGMVVLMHGGGVHDGYSDRHDLDSPPDANHWGNPYSRMAMRIAAKGVVVLQPIFQNQRLPQDEAVSAATVAACFGNRVSGPVGPGPDVCNSDPKYPCFTDLVDKVAWTPTTKANIVFIGHSAGGVTGLYVPDQYGSALKGLIMIDPDKATWQTDPPTRIAMSGMPIVHIYPDFFGPHKGGTASELFRIGATASCVGGTKNNLGCRKSGDCPGGTCNGAAPHVGPWVPLGIRDYGNCTPSTGCYDSHHCAGLVNDESYLFFGGGHEIYCGLTNPAGAPDCVKEKVNCGGAQYCGQFTKCINGGSNATGLTWSAGTAGWIVDRYVTAYTACLAAEAGPFYQQYVDGLTRSYEDQGIAGATCTKRGKVDTVCGAHTWYGPCEADYETNGCVWSENYDDAAGNGKVIRINDGAPSTVTEYTDGSTTHRYYGAYENFNVGGTGSFQEQIEKVSGSNAITCQSGILTF